MRQEQIRVIRAVLRVIAVPELAAGAEMLGRRPARKASQHEPSNDEENCGTSGSDGYRPNVDATPGNSPPAEQCAQPAADERARDPEDDGDDAAGRIAAGDEKLREGASDQPEKDPVEPEGHGARR